MHIKMISVAYGRKFNLGNYNSVEISQSLWADLEPGDDPDAAALALHAAARDHVRQEFQRLEGKKKNHAAIPADQNAKR